MKLAILTRARSKQGGARAVLGKSCQGLLLEQSAVTCSIYGRNISAKVGGFLFRSWYSRSIESKNSEISGDTVAPLPEPQKFPIWTNISGLVTTEHPKNSGAC
jgi:hypothetical protein